MSMVTIKATDLARELSEILNRVRYQGQSFEVKRGREIVARIVPPRPPRSLKISELSRMFKELPGLDATERRSFQRDLRTARSKARPPENPWD